MNCCTPFIRPFEQSLLIVIPYTASLKERFGDIPSVIVYHLVNGRYEVANVEVSFDAYPANELRVNNGGVATGFIKVFK